MLACTSQTHQSCLITTDTKKTKNKAEENEKTGQRKEKEISKAIMEKLDEMARRISWTAQPRRIITSVLIQNQCQEHSPSATL